MISALSCLGGIMKKLLYPACFYPCAEHFVELIELDADALRPAE